MPLVWAQEAFEGESADELDEEFNVSEDFAEAEQEMEEMGAAEKEDLEDVFDDGFEDIDDLDQEIVEEDLGDEELDIDEEVVEEWSSNEGEQQLETVEEQLPVTEDPMLEDDLIVEEEPLNTDDSGSDLMLAETSEPEADDAPNLEFEARLYDLYINYYSKQIQEDEWLSLVADRASESYTIQSGDTLWGLSETFFGDGNYWPKIWSVNRRLENPHLLQPGHYIHFILGNEEAAPAFTISENEKMPMEENVEFAEELDKDLSEEDIVTDEEIDEIIIPPPTSRVIPVALNLPPSLPRWKNLLEEINQASEILHDKPPTFKEKYEIPVGYFIDDQSLDHFGKVVEVYVKSPKGKLAPGQKFLAVAKKSPVTANGIYLEDATPYEVQSYIEVVAPITPVDEFKDRDFNFYRCLVLGGIAPVEVGASLVKEDIQYLDISQPGQESKLPAKLIGGDYSSSRTFFSRDAIVYLNRGAKQGFKKGMVLPIYQNRKERMKNTVAAWIDHIVGRVKIVRAGKNFSTGVIVEATEDIRVGDYIGSDMNWARELVRKQEVESEDIIKNGTDSADLEEQFDESDDESDQESIDSELEEDKEEITGDNDEFEI